MKLAIPLAFLVATLLTLAPATAPAQSGPVAGSTYTVVYNPHPSSPLARADALTLLYVFDFWNVRYGTRMALWQNVLRPDTSRLRMQPMTKKGESWEARIAIPGDAALLSWVVGDGEHLDGNGERTYVEYVLRPDGVPALNARYFNVQFMRLAGQDIGLLIREMERELSDYPKNFPAYHQYFSLLIEQGRGSVRIQERIANRLQELERLYGTEEDFLNLAAQTWYYLLQDQTRAFSYRERIPPARQWPQVLRMVNREEKQMQDRDRQLQSEQRRAQILNTELPEFNLRNEQGGKVSFPARNGKPSVLVFWASTSENSKRLLAELPRLLRRDDVDVVLVSLDPDESKAAAFVRESALPYRLLFNQGAAVQILGVDSIPVAFVIDGRDIIRSIHIGYSTAQLEELRAALATIGN